MSIVLVIIAVVVGGGMTMFSASLQKRQFQETQFKLKAIQKALLDYRMANNRIPCPADVTLALTDTNFGVEASTAGDCYSTGTVKANYRNLVAPTGTTHTTTTVDTMSSTTGISAGMAISGSGIPVGDTVASVTNGTTIVLTTAATASAAGVTLTFVDNVQGMVPTVTLRLPDDYAIDGWGRRIMYAVDARFTATSALTSTVIPATDAGYRMTVNDESGNAKTYAAAYVLVSFGPNGHGAFPRNGAALNARISSASANTDEQKNCDCSSATPPVAASTNGIFGVFVQKQPTLNTANVLDSFDDIVAFGSRSDLRSPTE